MSLYLDIYSNFRKWFFTIFYRIIVYKELSSMISSEDLQAIYKMISKNIKYFRLNNNSEYADEFGRISQEKLAELCNVSRSLIANIESTKVVQGVSIKSVANISKALGVPFEEFFKERK